MSRTRRTAIKSPCYCADDTFGPETDCDECAGTGWMNGRADTNGEWDGDATRWAWLLHDGPMPRVNPYTY